MTDDKRAQETQEYIADHYGHCVLKEACECLRRDRPWLGSFCAHWKPAPFKTFEEMRAAQVAKRKENLKPNVEEKKK